MLDPAFQGVPGGPRGPTLPPAPRGKVMAVAGGFLLAAGPTRLAVAVGCSGDAEADMGELKDAHRSAQLPGEEPVQIGV